MIYEPQNEKLEQLWREAKSKAESKRKPKPKK